MHFPSRRLIGLFAAFTAACSDKGSTNPPPAPAAVTVVAGDGQQARVGAALTTQLSVRVSDAKGQPLAKVAVSWTVSSGSVSPGTTTTDASGMATGSWTLGTTAGSMTASASVSGLSAAAVFTAVGLPDVPATFAVSPDSLLIKAVFDTVHLTLAARDKYGNAVGNVKVGWTIPQADVARIDSAGTLVSLGSGIVRAIANLGTLSDTLLVVVDNIAPAVVIESPTTQATYATTAAQLALSGIATDNVTITSLSWSTDKGSSGQLTPAITWAIPTQTFVKGETRVSVVAKDRVGNADTARVSIMRNDGVTYTGAPALNPTGSLVGVGTHVRVLVRLSLDPGATLQALNLVQVNAAGQVTGTLGSALDNGNLSNGDEIQADGIYSGYVNITGSVAGTVGIRAQASLTVGGASVTASSATADYLVYSALTTAQASEVTSTQSSVVGQLSTAKVQTMSAAVSFLTQQLKSNSAVSRVSQTSATALAIEYKSGIHGGIQLIAEGAQGSSVSEQWAWPGVYGDSVRRAATVTIARRQQTVGSRDSVEVHRLSRRASLVADGAMLNRKVLVFDPFATAFWPNNKGDAVKSLAEASKYHLSVTHLKDGAATVAALQTMPDYGLVVIDTHGDAGEAFLTSEEATPTRAQQYEPLLMQGKLAIYSAHVVRSVLGWLVPGDEKPVFAVNGAFISGLSSRFPQSVIFASYCEGLLNPYLKDAFLNQGAQTYLGWDKSFYSNVGKTATLDVIGKFVGSAKDIGAAYTAYTDPTSGATLRLAGLTTAHYSNGLVNGDFETGDLSGWTTIGDGRVISRLGPVGPTDGSSMAIISTGLGFTTSSGAISQAFDLSSTDSKIELRWNFLSEEFMEFVGSQYQDTFRVRLVTPSGVQVVFRKTIDQFAAEYTLTKASPGIVFDQGDVYQTGWLSMTLDVTAYRGKSVTIIFDVGDVGDSLYDSAVLLDGIVVKP